MIDPILIAVTWRFVHRRLWSRGGHVFASAQSPGGGWTTAVGRDATDCLATLLARHAAQSGTVDA